MSSSPYAIAGSRNAAQRIPPFPGATQTPFTQAGRAAGRGGPSHSSLINVASRMPTPSAPLFPHTSHPAPSAYMPAGGGRITPTPSAPSLYPPITPGGPSNPPLVLTATSTPPPVYIHLPTAPVYSAAGAASHTSTTTHHHIGHHHHIPSGSGYQSPPLNGRATNCLCSFLCAIVALIVFVAVAFFALLVEIPVLFGLGILFAIISGVVAIARCGRGG